MENMLLVDLQEAEAQCVLTNFSTLKVTVGILTALAITQSMPSSFDLFRGTPFPVLEYNAYEMMSQIEMHSSKDNLERFNDDMKARNIGIKSVMKSMSSNPFYQPINKSLGKSAIIPAYDRGAYIPEQKITIKNSQYLVGEEKV
ncbi:hypothetical protein ACTID9_21815 [Brevibacillus fluminis]|uniref:hypothetical protein n=1 Tax=Brevibacillus fluminis TaxID=511487 RepID=UPI003F896407